MYKTYVDDENLIWRVMEEGRKWNRKRRELYERAGEVHTRKEVEVGMDTVKEIQSDINGNTSMLIKFFMVGQGLDQVES